jgi:hypothetical protein
MNNYFYSITTVGYFRFAFSKFCPNEFLICTYVVLDSIYSSPSIISSSSDLQLTPKRNRTASEVLSASSFSAFLSVLTRRTSLTAMMGSSFSSGCSSQQGNPHPTYPSYPLLLSSLLTMVASISLLERRAEEERTNDVNRRASRTFFIFLVG